MAVHEMEQARGSCVSLRVRCMKDTDDEWRCVAARAHEEKLQPTRGGACEVVSSRSWLGFARDWLFCHSMPLLW